MFPEGDPLFGHRIHNGQAVNVIAGLPQEPSAVLEALFNGDPDTGHLSARLLADVQEPLNSFAVCHEIIHDQYAVAAVQVLLRKDHHIVDIVGIGMYDRSVQVTVQIHAAGLFGKDERSSEHARHRKSHCDSRRFHRQYTGNSLVFEMLIKSFSNPVQQFDIQLMVKEAVHLQDITLPDLAVFLYPFLKKIHSVPPSEVFKAIKEYSHIKYTLVLTNTLVS